MTAIAVAQDLAPTLARRAAEDWDNGVRRENVADLRASGLPSLTIPREFGGGGEGTRTASRVITEIARRDASTALILAMHYIHTAGLFDSGQPSPVVATLAEDLARTRYYRDIRAALHNPPAEDTVRDGLGTYLLNEFDSNRKAVRHAS